MSAESRLANDVAPDWVARTVDYAVWPALMVGVGLVAVGLTPALGQVPAFGVALVAGRLAIMAMEVSRPLLPNCGFYRDRYTWSDIGHGLLRILLGPPVAAVIAWQAAQLKGLHVEHLWPSHAPLLAQAALCVVVFYSAQYWLHRLEHRVGLLWRFHAIHHSPTELHLFKNDRDHFLEIILFRLTALAPLIIAGAPPVFFLWLALWDEVNGMLKHSNVRHTVPEWLHFLVPVAALHRIHHSTDMAQGNSNFASMPIMDMLFGTYSPPSTRIPRFGLEGDPVPQAFVPAVLHPLRVSAGDLFIPPRRQDG